MLETIRDYAGERLAARGDAAATRDRHAAYYLGLFEDGASRVLGPSQREILDQFAMEHGNLRAATAHAIESGDAVTALRLAAASWRFWQMRGFLLEGLDRARQILAMPGADAEPAARLRALEGLGGMEYWHGDFADAMVSYREALSLAEQLAIGPPSPSSTTTCRSSISAIPPRSSERRTTRCARGTCSARSGIGPGRPGRCGAWSTPPTTRRTWSRAGSGSTRRRAIFRETNDRFMLAWALYMKANVLALDGELREVRATLREALQIFVDNHDFSGYALILDAFAVLDYAEGDAIRAMTLGWCGAGHPGDVGHLAIGAPEPRVGRVQHRGTAGRRRPGGSLRGRPAVGRGRCGGSGTGGRIERHGCGPPGVSEPAERGAGFPDLRVRPGRAIDDGERRAATRRWG